MPVKRCVIDGRRAWSKTYPAATAPRRGSLRLLAAVARRLGLQALRPPPHRGGRDALRTEARRLRELAAQGVRVPPLFGEGEDFIVIGDSGRSLASRLKRSRDEPAAQDALVVAAIDAIGDAHRRGAYFGQPVPRNITVDADGIGFIDFEEDPLEVMSLPAAQARDWVMFTFGVMKYYDARPERLAQLLDAAFREESPAVGAHVHVVGDRLYRLAQAMRRFGRSARVFAHSIVAMRARA